MTDENVTAVAKEIARHLAGTKRQLTEIKWLMAVITALALGWAVIHLGEAGAMISGAIKIISTAAEDIV